MVAVMVPGSSQESSVLVFAMLLGLFVLAPLFLRAMDRSQTAWRRTWAALLMVALIGSVAVFAEDAYIRNWCAGLEPWTWEWLWAGCWQL